MFVSFSTYLRNDITAGEGARVQYLQQKRLDPGEVKPLFISSWNRLLSPGCSRQRFCIAWQGGSARRWGCRGGRAHSGCTGAASYSDSPRPAAAKDRDLPEDPSAGDNNYPYATRPS